MKSLGNLIRKYIAANGLTIYKTASLAGINRTTLQKVLSDERNASEELIEKLLAILKLSPTEEQELKKLFQIQQMGEETYLQRQYIKHSLEAMADLDGWFSEIPPEGAAPLFPSGGHLALQAESALVQGLPSVQHLLFSVAGKVRQMGEDAILLYAPGNLSCLKSLFFSGMYSGNHHSPIHLRHITPIIKVPAASAAPRTNLEILFNVFPFTISQHFRYEVFCFYSNDLLPEKIQYAFPYYLVAGNTVILLSCDSQTALCLRKPEIVTYFRNLFLDSLNKTTALVTSRSMPVNILQELLNSDQAPLCALEWQPCLTSFLSENMAEKYVPSDLPDREDIVRLGSALIRQLARTSEGSCIFSRSGVEDFAQTGIIVDLPTQYIQPLDVRDRIQVLEALCQACQEDRKFLRLINPVTFHLPRHFYAAIRSDDVLDFCGMDAVHSEFNYIRVTEQSFLEAFRDFFQYLPESGLVCSKEETLSTLRDITRRLKEYADQSV